MKKRRVVLTTEAHREAFDGFADALHAVESREGWRSSEVLRHFLDASFHALRGRLLTGEAWEKNEADYMALVGRCRKPRETMADLSRMLGETARALRAEPVDFVGPVFSELSADAGMGQFFTPYHLSYFMAKATLSDAKAMLGDRAFITLAEPACGVGGMILAANVVLREAGIDVATQAHWTAIDVDHRAVCGCYLQLSLTDCSADVYRGNALGDPRDLVGTRTIAAAMFPKIERPTASPDPAAPSPAEPVQLTMF